MNSVCCSFFGCGLNVIVSAYEGRNLSDENDINAVNVYHIYRIYFTARFDSSGT